MTRFADRRLDLDTAEERRRRALESMDWNRERRAQLAEQSADVAGEADEVDDGPLIVHTVGESDPPG